MPRVRPKLTAAQELAKAARAGRPFERVTLPAKVGCPACGRDFYPDAEGRPRPHERPARPGEDGYRADVPTYVTCEPVMTLEEHYRSLPDELRVRPGLMPAEVVEASEYAAASGAMLDGGVPVDQLPTYTEWVNRG